MRKWIHISYAALTGQQKADTQSEEHISRSARMRSLYWKKSKEKVEDTNQRGCHYFAFSSGKMKLKQNEMKAEEDV